MEEAIEGRFKMQKCCSFVEAEKEIFASIETNHRFALFLSNIANPFLGAIPTFLLIAFKTAPSVGLALLWWGVTVVGSSFAPLLFVAYGVRRGIYTDRHVSRREQRFVPLLFGIGCIIAVLLLLHLLHASLAMMATLVAVIVALVIATVITTFWKISFHLVGVAGAITAISFIFGPLFLLLAPLVVLVAWARWQVRAHTLLQALAGTALAVAVTVVTFGVFGFFS
jgi:hypothetical protein